MTGLLPFPELPGYPDRARISPELAEDEVDGRVPLAPLAPLSLPMRTPGIAVAAAPEVAELVIDNDDGIAQLRLLT